MIHNKLSMLKAAAARGDWNTALAIAAKFPRLGEHAPAIMRAHQAAWHPEFARQLGQDPETLIAVGIKALRARYNLSEDHERH